MKVKILLKNIKEGDAITGTHYCIKSLFVSFDEEAVYTKVVAHLKAMGADSDKIEKFCKPKEYKEQISYAFGLNCSHYTFDRVQRFGILDANIVFNVNEKGFINAKIQVIDKKEQINSYEMSTSGDQEEEVNGWNVAAPEPVIGSADKAEPAPVQNLEDLNSLNPQPTDLPFN